MTLKKFAALFLTLAMLVSAAGITALAADTVEFELKLSKTDVYVDDIITVDLYVTLPASVTTLRQAQIDFSYNPEVLQPVKVTDNSAAIMITQAITISDAFEADYWLAYGNAMNTTAGTASYSGGYNYQINPTGTFENVAGGKMYSFAFKALAEGDMDLTATAFTWQYGSGDTDKYTLADSSATDATASGLKVQVMPEAPTVTINTPAFTGEAVEEGTVTPSYVWDNGNQGQDAVTTTGDVSVVTWYVGGVAQSATTVAQAPVTVEKAWVGKELAYTVLPKADRNLVAEGTVSAKTVVGTVKAVATYAPSITNIVLDNGAVEDGEILASTPVEPVLTYDNTYGAVATYASAYKWFAVNPEGIADADAAIAAAKLGVSETVIAAGTEAEAEFDAADYKDWWAVVEITPSVTITGDTARTGEAVWAAALVTGEPPALDEVANGDKLATKKVYTSTSLTVSEKDVKFISNAVGDDDSITYTYEWYLADDNTFNIEGKTAISGDAIQKDGAQIRMSKVDAAEGKYLVLVVTAADVLGITASKTINFANAIAKASSSGSGTQGGASLVTGTQGPSTETPGTETPGTETPGEENNGISTENPTGDPTDGKEASASQFTDVDATVYAWGYNYLDALAKAGIVKGMDETTFAPEAETTYAQYIALVVRALGLTAEDAATTKVAAEHWSYAEVAVADALGLLADFETINADAPITREDMAVIAYKGAAAAELTLKEGEAVEFTDAASISEYAVEAVEALAKAGILNGMGDDTFAPKGTATRMQTAKVIGMLFALIG